MCPYFNQLTPEWVEGYAEAGADAVAALFFAFTPEDVARAFDDLEACREAAAAHGRLTDGPAAPRIIHGRREAALRARGGTRPLPRATRRAWHFERRTTKPLGPNRPEE